MFQIGGLDIMFKEAGLDLDRLYYIALIPPQPIQDDVLEFQHIAETKFEHEVTLHSPPHITLIPPFNVSEDELKPLMEGISTALKDNHAPFEANINRFYHLHNRTIMLELYKNKELDSLFNDVMLAVSAVTFNHNHSKFVPHITIANRDLSPDLFDKAFTYFSHIPYSRSFMCNEVVLFHFKDGKWKIVKKFML